MKTPIYDFLSEYADKNFIRAHMPGHKGRLAGMEEVSKLDITEIAGADSLYECDGIIAQSESLCASLYGSFATFYSAGGSTLSIQAMLYLGVGAGGKVIAPRNCHRAFLSACALLDIEVEWIFSKGNSILSAEVTEDSLLAAIKSSNGASALYITSPDYLGGMADIAKLADLCHENGLLLLVDNAHGTHLRFCKHDLHPITLGADICADSAHKTLPVLTGGGYLHISRRVKHLVAKAKDAMSLFGSTSPSYLILASLDLCNKYLANGGQLQIQYISEKITALHEKICSIGIPCAESEPMRITLKPNSYGYSGIEVATFLREQKIEVEYADFDYVVMLFSPLTENSELDRTYSALTKLQRKDAIPQQGGVLLEIPKRIKSIRSALFAESENLPVSLCAGKICAQIQATCPPGVPIIAPGELITQGIIKILQMYSIDSLNVIK